MSKKIDKSVPSHLTDPRVQSAIFTIGELLLVSGYLALIKKQDLARYTEIVMNIESEAKQYITKK